MTALVTLPLILVVLGMAGGWWRRGRWRDDKSIETHRSTLGVIEQVAAADDAHGNGAPDRNPAHVRILATPERPPPPADPEDASRLPLKPPPGPANRPSFPRLHPTEPAAEPAVVAPSPLPGPRAERGPSPARRHARHLQARTAATAAVAVVVVLALVAAAGLLLRGGGHPASAPRPRPPARVASGGSAAGGAHIPTPTTVPPPTIVATAATASFATYTANTTSLDVAMADTRPCWVELRSGSASGPLVYVGTLLPGLSQSFHITGAIWLRLGNPAGLRMAIDGMPVALPPTSDPFDLTVTGPAGA